MEFIKLLKDQSLERIMLVIALSLIYGISAGLFAPLILKAIFDILAGKHYFMYLLLLPASIGVQLLSYRFAEAQTAFLTEQALQELILGVANTLRNDELRTFEKRSRSEIYMSITQASSITDAATQSLKVIQNLITLLVLWIYIFIISMSAGTILLMICLYILLIQEYITKSGIPLFQQLAATEGRLFKVFHHFLDGFKEIKIYRHKNYDLFENYLQPLNAKIKEQRTQLVSLNNHFQTCILTSVFIFIGFEVFILAPLHSSQEIMQLIIVSFYLMKPGFSIFPALPVITKGKVALVRLQAFTFQGNDVKKNEKIYAPEKESFQTINNIILQDITYAHHEADQSGFSIGPLTLHIKAGELIFLSGGNGCGKSTLMKVFTGLYPIKSGEVKINGQRVDLCQHRYLFSAIFSDFHLFDSLYGIDQPDDQTMHDSLKQMELLGKTEYAQGRFSTVDLSTGQRKRLALVASLLENKLIYVFDEWAADQDPYFRRYFYEDLLPSLKRQGKTVLVVTHDDGYYHLADRVIAMKDGKIIHKAQSISKLKAESLGCIPSPETSWKPLPESEVSEKDDDTITSFKQFIPAFKRLALTTMINSFNLIIKIHIIFIVASLPPGASKGRYFFIFVISLLLDLILLRHFNNLVVEAIESFIARVRSKIINQVRKTALVSFEQVGVESIYTFLTADLKTLADLSFKLANTIRMATGMISMAIYFAWLAWPIFLIELIIVTSVGMFYVYNQIKIKKAIHKMRKGETDFLKGLTNLFMGFKELRLNDRKNDDFFDALKPLSERFKQLRLLSDRYMLTNMTLVYGVWLGLTGLLALLLPFVDFGIHILLTCIGGIFSLPIIPLVVAVPTVLMALISQQRLAELMRTLDAMDSDYQPEVPDTQRKPFEELSYQNLIFHYQDQDERGFSAGPLDLHLKTGEIIFITGGNGSGKSTLVKLMTGLYSSTGQIFLNHQEIDIRRHRYLFAIVFGDFHLFDRFYGFNNIDVQRVTKLLALMQLEKKVQFIDGKFSTLDLSTGQKKRLGLVTAVMEERPIYVFDEWAAEQDPHFRHYFYEALLPDLKASGNTVIAITHHEQYFHLADRVVKMELGQVVK